MRLLRLLQLLRISWTRALIVPLTRMEMLRRMLEDVVSMWGIDRDVLWSSMHYWVCIGGLS